MKKSKTKSQVKRKMKLHKQFGHPLDGDKLKNILKDANLIDQELFDMIDKVTKECSVCEGNVVCFMMTHLLESLIHTYIEVFDPVTRHYKAILLLATQTS